jgi:DNA polymerase (family 10)
MEKGMKLSEYGLFKGEKRIAGETEESIYKALGMEMAPPEMREDQGEVEASLRGNLPKVIGYGDIKGDLHIHSDWDGGADSIKDIARAAQKMGYRYAGIADHTKFLKIENGLDEKELERRNKEIDKLNQRLKGFRVLKGAETNILKDGSIDIRDDSLRKLDFVIAGVHSNFKMSKEEMTERIIKAIKNPNVDIISHPTGRILKRRDEYEIDFDKILRAAKEFKVALEINSYPERLDLKDQNIRRAKEAGVKMVINTDSHSIGHLGYMEFGIAQARRGWAEKEDILNAGPAAELLNFFNK